MNLFGIDIITMAVIVYINYISSVAKNAYNKYTSLPNTQILHQNTFWLLTLYLELPVDSQ